MKVKTTRLRSVLYVELRELLSGAVLVPGNLNLKSPFY